jgi:hypothetical protein
VPDEPSEETAAAVADYVERIAAEDNIDASATSTATRPRTASSPPHGDGRRLNDVFYQRREAILHAQEELPPALDGIEDDA